MTDEEFYRQLERQRLRLMLAAEDYLTAEELRNSGKGANT